MKAVDSLDSLKGNSHPSRASHGGGLMPTRENIQSKFVNQFLDIMSENFSPVKQNINLINYIITLPCFEHCIKTPEGSGFHLKNYIIDCNEKKYLLTRDLTQQSAVRFKDINRKNLPDIGKMHINVNYYNWVWLIENFFDFLFDKNYKENSKYVVNFKFILTVQNSNLIDLPSAPRKFFKDGELIPMTKRGKTLYPEVYFEDYRNYIGSRIKNLTVLPINEMSREEFMKTVGGGAFLVIYLKDIDGSSSIYQGYKIAQGFYDYLSQRYSKAQLNKIKPTIKQFGQIPILPETRLFSVGFGRQKIDKLNCIEKLINKESKMISGGIFSTDEELQYCEAMPFSDPNKFGPDNNIMNYDYTNENACNTSYDTTFVDPTKEKNYVCKKIDGNYYKFCIDEDCFKYPLGMDTQQLENILKFHPNIHLQLLKWKNKRRENRAQKPVYTPDEVPVGNYYKPGSLEKIKRIFGIQKGPNITPVAMGKSYKSLKRLAKKRKLRITKTVRGKRVYKTKKELQKQLKIYF